MKNSYSKNSLVNVASRKPQNNAGLISVVLGLAVLSVVGFATGQFWLFMVCFLAFLAVAIWNNPEDKAVARGLNRGEHRGLEPVLMDVRLGFILSILSGKTIEEAEMLVDDNNATVAEVFWFMTKNRAFLELVPERSLFVEYGQKVRYSILAQYPEFDEIEIPNTSEEEFGKWLNAMTVKYGKRIRLKSM